MINSSYRAFSKIVRKIIERMRQFYDESRVFRIMGETGENQYIPFSNATIKEQSIGEAAGKELFRKPIFDIKVKAQKQNPYSTLSQNETAMNLYKAGFFNPENAQPSLAAVRMMTFEGKKEVEDYISQGATLYNKLMQMQQQIEQLAKENAVLKGMPMQNKEIA